MFNIGDKVVYPMHGAGTIESIEEREMLGNSEDYYIIKMPTGGMKLMVPTSKVSNIGIREVSEKSEADKVFGVLEKPKSPYVHDANWSKRYNMNVDKIKSGDILEVAEVVRELSHRHMERGLSIGEKKMLATAKNILISEMVLSEEVNEEALDLKIEAAIKESYDASVVSDTNSNDEMVITKINLN
ncbi:MAG: CarD family transcriptional regulator [Clostridia bacterium]|nr:CarD family transcriptional regulator [Clostridia bacterium]